jgi:hypothetical protein
MWKVLKASSFPLGLTRSRTTFRGVRNFSNETPTFPKEWADAVKKELKDVPPEKLVWHTAEVFFF